MNTVALVFKNSDFIEGRGPLLFHKAFSTLELAKDYVSGKKGIYGSIQNLSNTLSKPSNGLYVFNGYEIRVVEIQDRLLTEQERKETEKEISFLEEKLNNLKEQLKR